MQFCCGGDQLKQNNQTNKEVGVYVRVCVCGERERGAELIFWLTGATEHLYI